MRVRMSTSPARRFTSAADLEDATGYMNSSSRRPLARTTESEGESSRPSSCSVNGSSRPSSCSVNGSSVNGSSASSTSSTHFAFLQAMGSGGTAGCGLAAGDRSAIHQARAAPRRGHGRARQVVIELLEPRAKCLKKTRQLRVDLVPATLRAQCHPRALHVTNKRREPHCGTGCSC